jgi:proteasome lid subunit RPN8/RPN11
MLNVITVFVLTFTAVDLHDPAVHGILAELLRSARYGSASTEEAAFLIRDSRGATFFLRGPLPAGTVAIVHTHPNWLPQPSKLDALVARQTSVPVYVVTLTRISRTEGGKPMLVASGDWSGS